MSTVRALLLETSEAELRHRRAIGADRWDEMWEGVLHMSPATKVEHQRIVVELSAFLLALCKATGRGTLHVGINVFGLRTPDQDYRIPDLTFVARGREHLLVEDGVRGGGPDVVFEIRSPGDESYDKLPFFAALGIREVVIVDRDSKRPEVFRLAGAQYLAVAPDREGWVTVEGLRLRLSVGAAAPPRLLVEDLDEPKRQAAI